MQLAALHSAGGREKMGNILELTKYQPQNPQSRKIWGKFKKRLDFPICQALSEESRNLHTLRCREHPTPASGGRTAREGSSAQFSHVLSPVPSSPKPAPCPQLTPAGWGMLSTHMGWTGMKSKVQTDSLFVSAIHPKPSASGNSHLQAMFP